MKPFYVLEKEQDMTESEKDINTFRHRMNQLNELSGAHNHQKKVEAVNRAVEELLASKTRQFEDWLSSQEEYSQTEDGYYIDENGHYLEEQELKDIWMSWKKGE